QAGPRAVAPSETTIGITWYDLQSNRSVKNRMFRYDDGSIAATWTMGMEASSYPDRGTGYNYFDGTTWGWGPTPEERIESIRCGWPSYSPLGPEGELVISHDFGAHTLYLNQRELKGEGDWEESAFGYTNGPPMLSWARHITSGPDNYKIHLLANSWEEYMGMEAATVYSRSTDGGDTWDYENILIEGMGPDDYNFIYADAYVWADPVGDNIAFLCAEAWHDLFMMKSTDNGETWEKTVIWEHPYPYFDWDVTITDTFFCVDNSATITLGTDGKAHVAFGISRVAHFETGGAYNYWPYVDGIGYWNEDMATFSGDLDALAPPQYGYANSEMIQDVNYVAWMQDVDGDGEVTLAADILSYRSLGPCTMPALTVDEYGNVILLFASTTETYVNDTYNYKHIWARAFNATAGIWEDFYDLTNDIVHIFDECIYPQVASSSDDNIYYMYNADQTPGLALDEDHAHQENRQIFASLEKIFFGLPVGVAEENVETFITVSQNFPNPVNNNTSVRVSLDESSSLSLELTNMVGQKMLTQDKGFVNAGSHEFRIDASKLQAGIYFYTVIADGVKVTKRMIIR
ncbi:MAG: T9SS type A sorting domain-containing protein, partial [Bacteroidota bacterium]